jgi:fatty-acyl-CoA synthase
LRDVGVAGEPALGGRLVIYRAVDPDTGEDLGRGAVGELQAYGLGVTRGYWGKSQATAEAFTHDGWLRTGDLGLIDDEDYIHLVGRLKDCYRCGGEQVVPSDIEDILLAHPGVRQALVVPVPDARMGEAGAALIVREDGTLVQADELLARAAERLARFKVPQARAVHRSRRGPPHPERATAEVPALRAGYPPARAVVTHRKEEVCSPWRPVGALHTRRA